MEPPTPDDMPARRGRAARLNPPNRFERLHHVEDPAALDEDELRQVPTAFFTDTSRSILSKNDSPDIPFTYSINPYRGCEHGCAYCLDGDTRILMGDGSTKPLRDVRVGDVIYGTEREGRYRRYVRTIVLAHWATEKEAFRITLADGTTLVASADHRFLTERGWKFVAGRRPCLGVRDRLFGASEGRGAPEAVGARLEAWGDVAQASSAVRKRDVEGTALGSSADLRVVSVEPLRELRGMFDVTTGTGDFIAEGVVSHNCYARPGHEYLGFSAGLDFETKILVKPEAPALLEQALARPSWEPQVVVMSGHTDPYQPVERRLELTRRCLEVFARFRHPVSLITKNHLVTRDVDVLAELAERDLVQVTVSITSLRDDLIGAMEPRTSRPERRLQALARLAEAGIPVGVNVAPVIPGLTDEEMPAILEAAAAHGARYAGYIVVRLPGPVKPVFLDWLERHYPDRKPRVVNRLREIRGEALNDPRFGTRMKGEGIWADLFRTLFRNTCRRHGLNRKTMNLSTEHFRRLRPGQMELF